MRRRGPPIESSAPVGRATDESPGRRVFLCGGVYVVVLLVVLLPTYFYFEASSKYTSRPPPPDYSLDKSWAALPNRVDDADIVPAECGQDRQKLAEADCFFLHPTSFFRETDWNAPIDDPGVNIVTDAGQLSQQASAFNAAARVYAPRYRQVSMSSQRKSSSWNNNGAKDSTSDLQSQMDLAFSDVVAAFEQFLVWNGDRPFFIAAHSQGTMHGKRLVKLLDKRAKAGDGASLKAIDRLVAAYLIGNTVQASEFPSWLRMCGSRDQVRCFVAYNTFVEGGNGSHWQGKLLNPRDTTETVACVNPLSWENNTRVAGKDLHLGSFPVSGHLFLANFHSNIISARCGTDGMLYVSPNPAEIHWGYIVDLSSSEPRGSLHAFDFPLFYRNIRINSIDRLRHFQKIRGHLAREKIEPQVCGACTSNIRCVARYTFHIFVALLILYAIALFFIPIYLPLFCLFRFRTQGRWPTSLDMVKCALCCCCCSRRRYDSRYLDGNEEDARGQGESKNDEVAAEIVI